MADVLSKSNLFSSVFDNGSASISHRRRNLSAVRFARCKSKSFEGLRSSPSSCLKSNGFLGKRLDFGDPCGKGVRANRLATPVQVRDFDFFCFLCLCLVDCFPKHWAFSFIF